MLHVFVETNWVIDFIAPFQPQNPARKLLEFADTGRLKLHLPAICLNEAENKTRWKSAQPKMAADQIREFVKSKPAELTGEDLKLYYRMLEQYEQASNAEFEMLTGRLGNLAVSASIEVFPLDDEMLRKALALRGGEFATLQPFDQAILAGVLVKAERLRDPSRKLVFCEMDSDLQPWAKAGKPKAHLADLYEQAGLTVLPDFQISSYLQDPETPDQLEK